MIKETLLTSFALFVTVQVFVSDLRGQELSKYRFKVSEDAGIRRRSGVISARLTFQSPLEPDTKFQLEQQGDLVPCQFTPVRDSDGSIGVSQ